MVLLQINFSFPPEMMGEALTENARPLAESINNEPGFISKIWIENPETELSGGIYLFKDMESAHNYAEMHSKRVEAMGAANIDCKYFNVNEPLSKVNKAF
ncbi:monooxygenase [Dysgonomonas macrotermitis]|uniref:Putative mono-oxygenase ydhR n=1 Tax=Dysgonomonas macrotermitis TaxID=1346286 RepID=A0A1M4ZXJ8_9BACT|nr:monooxygenase [Dysgonomonas macrotermitis]SHF22741.1 Putative mono-oxygenase ydhR [Dysgonomonas macrotermitis]